MRAFIPSLLFIAFTVAAPTSVLDFTLNDIDGKSVKLSEYKGKVILVVNVASRCGYTTQYEALQKIYDKYRGKGFTILGFPANNFMGQEPGSDAEVKQFCTSKYGVNFPMFSKISVKGDDKHPLYGFLTGKETNPAFPGEIGWNFEKFLVGRDGKMIGRYPSKTKPDSAELAGAIEKAL
jgi:glutathione peroxidase